VGLPPPLAHAGLLPPPQRRHRLVRHRDHRALDVPPRRQGRDRGQ
jgi:hypothetical protein